MPLVPSTCNDAATEVVNLSPSNTVTPSVTLALVDDTDGSGEVVVEVLLQSTRRVPA